MNVYPNAVGAIATLEAHDVANSWPVYFDVAAGNNTYYANLYATPGTLNGLGIGFSGLPAAMLDVRGSISQGAANGQQCLIQDVTELLTIAAAATTDTTFNIPANAVVLGVSVRVTTVIPTAATFTVTGATSGTAFNTAAVSTAATSTDPGTKAGAVYNGTAQHVRITPNLTPANNTGRVRVTCHFYTVIPPTS